MSLRQDALKIFRAGLAAADPVASVRQALKKFPEGRVWVIGAGKASARMAWAAEQELGSQIAGGWINTKDGHLAKLKRIELHECSHPVPDERGVAGSRRIAEIAKAATKEDIVLCLISGGASALMPLPIDGVSLQQKQDVTRQLLASGATIHEINCVRKHLSLLKGGQLAKLASPARVVALLLSDVIGDDLDVIGSGPTAPDATTLADAKAILKRYRITGNYPMQETPSAQDPLFKRVKNIVVGSNRIAALAAAYKAKELGYRTMILSTSIDGETRDVARVHAAIAQEISAFDQPLKKPACVISGGETTVVLKGKGKGGRNQEFVLSAALALDGLRNICVLSAGTDGTDGPTDAAGAICDGKTIERARKKGLNADLALDQNDAYPFFQALNDLVMTGPTGTNVMDLRIMLVR